MLRNADLNSIDVRVAGPVAFPCEPPRPNRRVQYYEYAPLMHVSSSRVRTPRQRTATRDGLKLARPCPSVSWPCYGAQPQAMGVGVTGRVASDDDAIARLQGGVFDAFVFEDQRGQPFERPLVRLGFRSMLNRQR